MNPDIINPLDYPGWDNLLLTNQDTSFFHSSLWARVLTETYRFTPLYFTICDPEELFLCIPIMEVNSILTGKRAVSLPFTDRCDPVVSPPLKAKDIWQILREHGRKTGWKYLEIRGGENCVDQNQSPSSWYYEHIIDLSIGRNEIYHHLKNSHKRNIKKAEKAGTLIDTDESIGGMREFYRLNCMTRKKHGLPPQPFSFFENIHKHIIQKGSGLLFLAYFAGKAIAGCIFLHFNQKAIYKYGASDSSYQNLRPNNLAMWKAIEIYYQKGFESLSLGRTDVFHEGLRQFKLGWGAKEGILPYYRYDFATKNFIKSSSKIEGKHTIFFRKLPIPLLRVAGSLLYRHMG